MKTHERGFSLDVIRTIAIISVVVIHTVNSISARIDFLGSPTWWVAHLITSFARVSIPLFIILSGYLILNKNETLSKTYRRIISRLLIPLLFWSLVYITWNGGSPSFSGLATLPERLFTGSVLHLYFLVIMIGLYAISPFVRAYFENVNQSIQKKVVFSTLIVGVAITMGQYVFAECYSQSFFSLWLPYTGLFLGGFFFGSRVISTKLSKNSLLVFLGSFLVTLLFGFLHMSLLRGGNSLFHPDGCISPYFDHYLSPNVIIMAFSLFLLLKNSPYGAIKRVLVKRIISSIAKASLGIYVIHLLFVELLDNVLKISIDEFAGPFILFALLKWTGVFLASYLTTLLLLKLPIVRKVLGEN